MLLGAAAALASAGLILLVYRAGPVAAVLLIAALAVLALALMRPLAGLVVAVALIPLELQTVPVGGVFNLTPTKAMFIAAALGWLIRCTAARERLIDLETPLAKPLVAMMAAAAVGLPLAADRMAVIKVLGMWAIIFVLYQMIVAEGRRSAVRWLIGALVLAGAAAGLMAVLGIAPNYAERASAAADPDALRAYGPFASPNILAGFLVLAIPAAVVFALRGPALLRPLAVAAVGLAAAGALLSASRGGAVAAVGALAALMVWRPARRPAVALVGIVLATTLVGGANPIGELKPLERLINRTDAPLEENPRLTQWEHAVGVFAENPLTGVGLANYYTTAPQYRSGAVINPVSKQPSERLAHPHNLGLAIASELGVVGLLALVWLGAALIRVLVSAYRRSSGIDRGLAAAIAATIVGLTVHNSVDFLLGEGVIAWMAILLAGCAVVLSRPGAQPAAERASPPSRALPAYPSATRRPSAVALR